MSLRCPEARVLLTRSLGESLESAESESLALHLNECVDCRACEEETRRLWELVSVLPAPAPSPQAEDALLAAAKSPARRLALPVRVALAAAVLLAFTAAVRFAPGPAPGPSSLAIADRPAVLPLRTVAIDGGAIERSSTLFEQAHEREWVVAAHASERGLEVNGAWGRGRPASLHELPLAAGLSSPVPPGSYALLFHTRAGVAPCRSCRRCGSSGSCSASCCVASAWDAVTFHRRELLDLWTERLHLSRAGSGRCRVCGQSVPPSALPAHRESCGGSVDAASEAAIPPGRLLDVLEPATAVARTADHLELTGAARTAFEATARTAADLYARHLAQLAAGDLERAAERIRGSSEYAALRAVLTAAAGRTPELEAAWRGVLDRTELGGLLAEARDREHTLAELDEWLLEDPIEGRHAVEVRSWVGAALGATSRLPDPARTGDDDLDSLVSCVRSYLENH